MTTPFKWGSEFLVNTTTTNGQSESSITALADGRFVVSWSDISQTGGDTSDDAVRAQIFNADGSKSGAEFLVNTTTANSQYESAITALADGRFVVSWSDYSATGGDTSVTAIRAQIFNADGSKSGAEFLVNTTTTSYQFDSAITALADGRFVVSWTDWSETGGDTSNTAVRAQIFNANGSKSGDEFLVNTTVTDVQNASAITALADGRFVVSWTDRSKTGDDVAFDAIRAQIFNANGSKSGTEFLVNTTTVSIQYESSITALSDGRFVVSWTDGSLTGDDTSSYAVRAQVFNADGSRSGAEFLVNTTVTGAQYQSSITALPDGRFVVSWTDGSQTGGDTSSNGIRAQVFNADGSKSGGEFLVNTTTALDQLYSAITALADGRFVVSWTDYSVTGDDTSISAIRSQIFDPRLAAVQLNGSAQNDQFVGTIFADTLRGGLGNDSLEGAAGDDVMYGEWGNDSLSGNQGHDRLFGDAGNDTLTGNSGDDVLDGGAGNDTLNGGIGIDVMIGGAGNDTFIVDTLRDVVIEEAGGGNDTVRSATISLALANYAQVENALLTGAAHLNLTGSNGKNTLTGNTGNNTINGQNGDDTIAGGGGNDTLRGGAGNDTIDGGAGRDVLDGGTGNDVLTGGGAADTFIFASGHDTARITDFQDNIDKLDLSSFGFANAAAARAFAADSGGNVVFTFSAGNVLTIDNITKAQLTAVDFIL